MGLMFRRRRPIARLAAGAATAGVAYHMGKRQQQQTETDEQPQAAYAASEAPPPQYAPAPPPPAPAAPAASGDTMAELEKLAEMHGAGALTDAEFAAAKAKLLGM